MNLEWKVVFSLILEWLSDSLKNFEWSPRSLQNWVKTLQIHSKFTLL